MITFRGPRSRLCDGLTRRDVLRIGGLGAFGATLGLPLASAGGVGPLSHGRAKSCIVLFLVGGPAQHSTWDPKPDAPAEVRGPFGPIATAVPGLFLGELMTKTAKVADKLCVLRAVSTGDNAHSSSGYYMLTGRPHQPMNFENANPGPPNDAPALGAVLGRVTPGIGGMPRSVTLPHRIWNTDGSVWPGQDAGYLGRAIDPWLLHADPSADGLRVDEITLPSGLSPERIMGRRDLLDRLGRTLDEIDRDPAAKALDAQGRQALALLQSREGRAAFRLEEETDAVRDLYGRNPFGQSVLLARRLTGAGVRLVQVNWYRGKDEPSDNPVWDTHVDEPNRLKNVLVPPADAAIAALIGDLDRTGRLDETLVVVLSEFGRSPRLEGRAGRGHWGSVFSVALAGGGIRGGMVHGASDRFAAHPRDGKVRPEDLLATIFHCLGFEPGHEYRDPLDRPFPISRGEVIRPILA
jgi:Protein of unknown function (DUF1501)